tara:strand:+ start:1556 stop:2509 length:954 start_codon:yes stop_codon:yes gene_type:complete
MTDRYLYFRSAAALKVPVGCTGPFSGDVCAGRSHMTFSLSCALRKALEAGRKLVVPDTFCCHALHCGRHICEPTRNFFSLEGGQVVLESEVATLSPTLLPCTQNFTDWRTTLVLQRPKECKRYWFQECRGAPTAAQSSVWQAWTPPENTTRWIQQAIAELRESAAAKDATVTCVHLRRTDKMGRDYPCSKRDLTPSSILRTLQTHYPQLSWLFVATDEKEPRYLQELRTVLSANYTVFYRSDLPLLTQIVGPDADVLADYGVCDKFPTIESREGRLKKEELTPYLTTDLKNGCEKPHGRCTRYACATPGQWSVPDRR